MLRPDPCRVEIDLAACGNRHVEPGIERPVVEFQPAPAPSVDGVQAAGRTVVGKDCGYRRVAEPVLPLGDAGCGLGAHEVERARLAMHR